MSGMALPSATGVTTKVTVASGNDNLFATWQSAFTRAASAASGFVSLEIIPAFAGSPDWHLIQRFRSAEMLELWRKSAQRISLLADLARMQGSAKLEPQEEVAPDFHSLSCVTEVITSVVEPGKEESFQAWAESVQAKQAIFPGYMGTLVQAPLSVEVPYWTTLVRYSTPAQLEAWLGSAERKALLQTADPLVSHWKSQRMASPFGGWFPSEPDRAPAPAWKQTTLVLLVLFPVVMLEIRFLSPFLRGQHVAIATFIGNAISVSLVSWPLMKIAVKFLGWWLQPNPARRWLIEVMGVCTLLALYAAEVLIFMLLY
jgi:uncharacterized protein